MFLREWLEFIYDKPLKVVWLDIYLAEDAKIQRRMVCFLML